MTALAARHSDPATSVQAPRSWKTPIIVTVVALVTLVAFGILPEARDVTFAFSGSQDAVQLPRVPVVTTVIGIVGGVIALLCAAASFVLAARRRKIPVWIPILSGLAFLVALLAFVGAGKSSGNVPVPFLLEETIGLSAAIVFGALAGVIGERVGVVNIAIEAQLLLGAFCAAVVASLTDSGALGILAAMVGGALVSMTLAAFAITYLVDQIIVGVVLNVLVVGLTNFLHAAILLDNRAVLNHYEPLPRLPIPLLSDIPVIGQVLFNQQATSYLMFLLVPAVWFLLFKTRWGLRVRALGEHPLAADTVGINVNRTRFWTVTGAGAIAGLGGASLALAASSEFIREVSGGQGYIALAAVILGRWNPWFAAAAAVLFGFSREFYFWGGDTSSGVSIPPDLIAMTPYLVALLAVSVLVGRSVAPRAVGKPYLKE
jgi:simple sugar transport system permease protein